MTKDADIASEFCKILNQLARDQTDCRQPKVELGFPSFRTTKSGDQVFISQKTLRRISSFSEMLLRRSPKDATIHSNSDWFKLVADVLCEYFSTNEGQVSPELSKSFERSLADEGILRKADRTHFFACNSISIEGGAAPALDYGRIKFHPKAEFEDFFQNILRKKPQCVTDNTLADFLQGANCIVSVRTAGMASNMSMIWALNISRIAVFSNCFLWERPSRVTDRIFLVFDHQPITRRALVENSGFLGEGLSGEYFEGGKYLGKDDWCNHKNANKNFFTAVEKIFNSFSIRPSPETDRDFIFCLYQSIRWYMESCQEKDHFTAVVKMIAALDALACGGKAAGIIKVIENTAGVDCEQHLSFENRSLKNFLKSMYSEGRSRSIHGTNDSLLDDWAEKRDLLDYVCSTTIKRSFERYGGNNDVSDPKILQKKPI